MSFFYPSSAASARSRRTRDKDGSNRANSISSHRRSKDYSNRPRDERSPPPKSPTPSSQSSLYTQQNLAFEQQADLPSSGPGSPKLALSPVLKPNQTQSGVYHLPFQPHTPAALQAYLETDDEEDDENTLVDSIHLTPTESSNGKDCPTRADGAESKPAQHADSIKPSPKQSESKQLPQAECARPTAMQFEQKSSPQLQKPSPQALQSSPQIKPSKPSSKQHEVTKPVPQRAEASRPPLAKAESTKAPSRKPSQDMIPMPREVSSLGSDSPRAVYRTVSMSRTVSNSTSNADAPPLPVHERSFTPPAPTHGVLPYRGSPAFASPLPIRPEFANHHLVSYHSPHMQQPSQVYQNPNISEIIPPVPLQQSYFMNPAQPQPPIGYNDVRASQMTEPPAWTQPQPEHVPETTPATEVDTLKVLSRIQSVLPDFQMLLDRYHETSKSLGVQSDEPTQLAQIRQDESNKHKDDRIESLSRELGAAHQKHAFEFSKVQNEINELSTRHQNVTEELSLRAKSHEDLKKDSQSLQREHAALSARSVEERQVFQQRELSLQDKLSLLTLSETTLKTRLSESEAESRKERDVLQAKQAREMKTQEENASKLRSQMDTATKSRDSEIDRLRRAQTEATECWRKEKESMNKGFDQERLGLKSQWEAHCRGLTDSHRKESEELKASQQKHTRRNEQVEAENEKLRKELKRAEQVEAENERLRKENRRIDQLEAENEKLRKENRRIDQLEAENEKVRKELRRSDQLQTDNDKLRKELERTRAEWSRDVERMRADWAKDVEKMKTEWTSDRSRQAKASADLRSAALKIQSENQNLQKMIQVFGEDLGGGGGGGGGGNHS